MAITKPEVRQGFDQMIKAALATGDLDRAARLEVAREYFTNPVFKIAVQDYVWQINTAQGKSQ